MATKGVCRSKTEESGAEYATVDYGKGGRLASIPRERYEANAYEPPYDQLPECDGSENANA